MTPIILEAFADELEKISGTASMVGLGGLTALEGAGALNKEKSKKERAMSGLAALSTGTILADELAHAGHLNKLKTFFGK